MAGQDQVDRRSAVHPTKGPGRPGDRGAAQPAVQASGPKGDNPGTAGPGPTGVRSETPENTKGRLNPSAPEDANTTPGSTGEK
jgi:hypothetical protein